MRSREEILRSLPVVQWGDLHMATGTGIAGLEVLFDLRDVAVQIRDLLEAQRSGTCNRDVRFADGDVRGCSLPNGHEGKCEP